MSAPAAPVVRAARREDAPAFLSLIRALAEFVKLPGPDDAAAARLVEDAFGATPRYEVLVAEVDGEVSAYAIFFPTYSTFRARPTLFLEDLFVHPRVRRRGVATAILAHLGELARARGCGRFEWMVLDWNVDAQKLYDGVGARMLNDWRLYRLDLPEPAGSGSR
jgi:GNAT superfamily N-acetyltransferase